jgi:hypothetical protein
MKARRPPTITRNPITTKVKNNTLPMKNNTANIQFHKNKSILLFPFRFVDELTNWFIIVQRLEKSFYDGQCKIRPGHLAQPLYL